MSNVLEVKTHLSDGRAWAAWTVKAQSAVNLDYVVSVNGKRRELKVFVVNGQASGKFFGQDVERVAFDLTDITDSRVGKKIIDGLNEPFVGKWVYRYSSY